MIPRYAGGMQLRWAAFGMVLAGSIGLNGYLLLAGNGSAHGAVVAPMHGGHRAIPVVHPVHHEPRPERPALSVPAEIRALDDSALDTRLAAAEKQLDKMLPLEDRFELGERVPELEERIRPLLDGAFVADDGTAVPYDLECRRDVCRIENVGLLEWQNLVSDALGVHQERMSMGESVYVQIVDESLAAARHVTELLVYALRASKEARACITPDAQHGVVTITFVLDPGTRQIHAVAGGALAGDVVGVCIRNAADAIASKATVPANVTELPDWACPYEVR